ncbi:MAG: beta-glucosidase [Anaerolineae bacterium]|nr:beta-glucosidase [Anaerolineae bacterium]
MTFPKDFVWGTATSAYQIEGGGLDFGRGECIWHRFSHTSGKVRNGDTGEVACDHIHRYPQDVAMMSQLGIDGYRFSVSWPRVIPAGTGTINQQGLDFYKRLIEKLHQAHITPYLTLYHWDLPQALQDQGGWENPDSVHWYTEYADLVSRELGSEVRQWTTFNEPFVSSIVGNLFGVHAPGKQDPVAAFTVAHHLLLSHGSAVPIIRQNVPDAQVGITLDLAYSRPYRPENTDDQIAARHFAILHNNWFLDPVFRGVYPADGIKWLEPLGALSNIDISEIGKAQVPIDFLGINYYTRHLAKATDANPMGYEFVRAEGNEHTALDWEVYPDGLLHTLLYVHNGYYPSKIFITENGCNYDDPEPANGVVDDPKRVAYYRQHIDAVGKAIALGVPVKGYFAWSLMDNFEWAEGYQSRFGLYYVDFATQERTPKKSALYYRDRISQERAKA